VVRLVAHCNYLMRVEGPRHPVAILFRRHPKATQWQEESASVRFPLSTRRHSPVPRRPPTGTRRCFPPRHSVGCATIPPASLRANLARFSSVWGNSSCNSDSTPCLGTHPDPALPRRLDPARVPAGVLREPFMRSPPPTGSWPAAVVAAALSARLETVCARRRWPDSRTNRVRSGK
jgi:hypothetical protein